MWQCVKCREKVEDDFAVCWNCGTSRDGTEDPEFRSADDVPSDGEADNVHSAALSNEASSQRLGCLTAWLVLVILANAFVPRGHTSAGVGGRAVDTELSRLGGLANLGSRRPQYRVRDGPFRAQEVGFLWDSGNQCCQLRAELLPAQRHRSANRYPARCRRAGGSLRSQPFGGCHDSLCPAQNWRRGERLVPVGVRAPAVAADKTMRADEVGVQTRPALIH
jgi:hypothetical protein